jgi:hypothetical protein
MGAVLAFEALSSRSSRVGRSSELASESGIGDPNSIVGYTVEVFLDWGFGGITTAKRCRRGGLWVPGDGDLAGRFPAAFPLGLSGRCIGEFLAIGCLGGCGSLGTEPIAGLKAAAIWGM